MAGEFDASKEADKVEQLAKERLDESDPDKGKEAAKRLCDEWLSMDQSQRNAVADQLQHKYANSSWDTLPVPTVQKTFKGDVTEIDFMASTLDWSSGPGELHLYDRRPIEPSGFVREDSESIGISGFGENRTTDYEIYPNKESDKK